MPKSTSAQCWCGVTVSRKADLRRHQRTHAPDKDKFMHKCPYGCGYEALQKSNLTTHINTHTGERPHQCPDCQFAAKDPSSLHRHRRRRHGDVPTGRSRNPTSVASRNAKRQQDTSSSVSPSDSGTPSSPPLSAGDRTEEGNKDDSATYSTGSIIEPVQVNDVYITPNNSLQSTPLDSTLEAASTYSQLPEQESLRATYPTIQSVCDMAVTEEVLNNFLLKYGDWDWSSAPSLCTPMLPYSVDNVPMSTPAALPQNVADDVPTPAQPPYYPFHDQHILEAFVPAPSPVTLPSYEMQYPATGTPHEYHAHTTVASPSHAQFSQPRAFAPDMGTYWYTDQQDDNVYSTYSPAVGFAAPSYSNR